jgi:hypothetical protein
MKSKNVFLSILLSGFMTTVIAKAQQKSDSIQTAMDNQQKADKQKLQEAKAAEKLNKELVKAEKKVDTKSAEVQKAQDKADVKGRFK